MMDPADGSYSPIGRSERLVATGRVVLAVMAFVATWIEPSEPATFAALTYSLLGGYTIYSIVIALGVFASPVSSLQGRLFTHSFDLAIFAVFMYLTEGPISPFYAYFTFSIVCGTLRFGWRGALWTALAALTIYVGLGFYAVSVLNDPEFQINRFMIRSGYLGVLAVLLIYLGAHQERLQNELMRLASWPQSSGRTAEDLADEILRHVATIFPGARLLLHIQPEEEPHAIGIELDRVGRIRRSAGHDLDLDVAPELARVHFLCRDLNEDQPNVICGLAPHHGEISVVPVSGPYYDRHPFRSIVSLRLGGGTFAGRLHVLDRPGGTIDDLILGEIVSRLTCVRIDHHFLQQRAEENAVVQERVRLARDLHDGLLQSMTGVALQLQMAQRAVEESPSSVRAQLARLQSIIEADQRDLRIFIQQLKPAAYAPDSLAERLAELGDRVRLQWDIDLELDIDLPAHLVPQPLRYEIYNLVHEGIANSARHAEASIIRVRGCMNEEHVMLRIEDDGSGFPFAGTYTLEELTAMRRGPVSLRERVASIGGRMTLQSSDRGAAIDIELPLDWRGL